MPLDPIKEPVVYEGVVLTPEKGKGWTREQAIAAGKKGHSKLLERIHEKQKREKTWTGRKQDLPFQLRPVTEREWNDVYLTRAFDEPWRTMYQHTLRDLRKLYAPNKREAPQYQILVQRAAALHTLIRWMEAEHKESAERNSIDVRLKDYVAQLQRYTEAEKRVDILVDAAQFKVMESMIAIAEYEIEDKALLHRYLSAVQRALGAGALGDDDAMRRQLREPAIDGEYVEMGESA